MTIICKMSVETILKMRAVACDFQVFKCPNIYTINSVRLEAFVEDLPSLYGSGVDVHCGGSDVPVLLFGEFENLVGFHEDRFLCFILQGFFGTVRGLIIGARSRGISGGSHVVGLIVEAKVF